MCGTNSQISGQSRVATVIDSLEKRSKMLNFKEKFLDNGTVIGLILETDEILNKKLRERKQEELQLDYNPSTGQSSVLILDGGMKAKPYSQISSFKDLDFKEDIEGFNKSICLAFGVPQVLLDGGNNANIRPNIELFYYMTIIPMLNKLTSSLTFFFGYKITPNTKEVAALTPDKEAEAKHLTSLVNNGIMTGNEARLELNLEPLDDEQMDRIRIPANVAGSATGVSGQEGGRPQGSTEGDKE
ncbi:portal protein [Bacteriophage T5-like saus47N]|uniref:Portal protein n=5 Tax=Tequintavirus chee24 TaxID=2733981 RepID=A0A2K8HSR9_9CAUD|nr:portal protein [Escherichia phage chee24]ASU01903.1 portal protein [Bacteriophage T5-like pork29]ASU02054.1 portal protein [Bacteriophage T5-like saus47N]ASU02205.1 portal protein [Bacteriophage T5-like saus111K]ASU02356.1 portal protein [Bacteriophage T5-like poul124]ASU01598.1 portal protein [Escherichia phage chee24]